MHAQSDALLSPHEQLRILHIIDLFAPSLGGAETVALEVCRALTRRGHKVMVLTRRLPRTLAHECLEGVAVRRVGPSVAWRAPFAPIRDELFLRAAATTFRRLTESFRPDVLMAHPFALAAATLPTNGPLVSFFYAPAGAEYRVHRRGLASGPLSVLNAPYARLRAWLRDRYQRAVLLHSSRVLTLSRYSESTLSAWLPQIAQDRIRRLPGGVDSLRFHPAPDRQAVRRHLGLPSQGTILLTVRRLAPRMGLEDLLTGFSLIEDLSCRLIVVGQGPLANRLRRTAETLGIADRTQFVGGVAAPQLPAYYQAADIFVLPTLTLEAFGLVTLEALACGTPVVATSVGANPELIEPLSPDLLVPAGDPPALARALRRLILSGPALASLRTRCSSYVEHNFSWERTADDIGATCRELLSTRGF